MNVNVTYNLSPAGQRAAILAGRTATSSVSEPLPATDLASILDRLRVGQDGSLSLSVIVDGEYGNLYLPLDAPPATVEEALAIIDAENEAVRGRIAARAAELAAQEAARVGRNRARIEADAPAAAAAMALADDAFLAGVHARGTFPEGGNIHTPGGDLCVDVPTYAAIRERLTALTAAKNAAEAAGAAAKAAAKAAALEADIAAHGGYHWAEHPMCPLRGFGIWASGQSKRWVGVFSQARGIDRFLPSPRGEWTWDISGLRAGECVQVSGYDTNSRGHRRSVSEFFGVVVRNDETGGLVIRKYPSRAACLSAR